jgi:putative endonuclease
MTTVGELGENLVARWLELQGWKILQRRWRSRWGEIDLIALSPRSETLIFVEVKTRSQGNWDQGGRLAIDRRKQAKLLQSASFFLSRYPQWSETICRFDAAFVHCRQEATASEGEFSLAYPCLIVEGYQLELRDYFEAAFDRDSG